MIKSDITMKMSAFEAALNAAIKGSVPKIAMAIASDVRDEIADEAPKRTVNRYNNPAKQALSKSYKENMISSSSFEAHAEVATTLPYAPLVEYGLAQGRLRLKGRGGKRMIFEWENPAPPAPGYLGFKSGISGWGVHGLSSVLQFSRGYKQTKHVRPAFDSRVGVNGTGPAVRNVAAGILKRAALGVKV